MQFSLDILKRCWFLAGPTACGKSDAGLELARRIDAEIVSLDSMALYRGMDVGTAKPSADARALVPHHLIDVIDPHEEYAVADYLHAAETVCRSIWERGRTPLFVGGTGLYLRAILRGVFDGPPADWEFRALMEREAAENEPGYLHRRLKEVDPASATVLHPNDARRLIRALEVWHVTGRPLSEQQQQLPLPRELRPPCVFWLSPPRDWLYRRIDQRVEAMLAAGLVEEVRRILSADPPPSRTARQALGYKELIDHLTGRISLEQAVERIQTSTRQFAKRQHTWFRNLEECKPIEITGDETPSELAEMVLAAGSFASQ
jgi:tRNA dimethylallyltransferase